jgi:hypothetical protein
MTKRPAQALLAPVPKVHLDSLVLEHMTTAMFGTMRADLFWERGVQPGALVYLYESIDEDRPVGESQIRWQGTYVRYVPWEKMRSEEERLRPKTTHGEGRWAIYWEVTDLRRLGDDESFPVSDFSTEDGHRISPAFVPHGPVPIAG